MRWNVPGNGGRVLACAAIALIGSPPAASHGPRAELVIVRDGEARSVPVFQERGYPVAAAAELGSALGYSWSAGTLNVDGVPVRFLDGSPFFTSGGVVHQLANPVYLRGSALMVPVSWGLDWLPRNRPGRWTYLDGQLVERRSPVTRRAERDRWLVVVDAGHGGPDPGARGVKGTREKDVTLSIARKLAARLAGRSDIRVVLTRERDTLIALADRPKITRIRGIEEAPDLFVSIHANSMPRRPHPMNGFETYFLAVAKTEQARRVALRENASLQFEGEAGDEDLDPLQFILSDLQSTGNMRESNLLAAQINRTLGRSLKAPDRGVKQAGFWVLVGATMPSVLVEVGYLSHPPEEKLLRSPSYQAKIADALAEAVVGYLSGYGQRVWSSNVGGE